MLKNIPILIIDILEIDILDMSFLILDSNEMKYEIITLENKVMDNIFYFDVEIVRSFSLGYLQGGLKNII